MNTRTRARTVPAKPAEVLGPTSSTWQVNPAHSAARFAAATLWGRVPVAGELGPATGELVWDGTAGRGRLSIATAELASGIRLRDHHLRSSAFFDVEHHPEIIFDAHNVAIERGRLRLTGELLVRGRRRAFNCTATLEWIDEERIALETNAALDLDELGMSRGLLHMLPAQVSANVRIVLDRAST